MADAIAEGTTTATRTYSLKDSYKAVIGVLFEDGRKHLDRLLAIPGRGSLEASLTQAYHVLRVANSLELGYQGLDTLLQQRVDRITRAKPQAQELSDLFRLVQAEKTAGKHGEKLNPKDPVNESYTDVAKELLSKEFEEDEFNLEHKLYDNENPKEGRDYNLRKIKEVLALMNDMGACYGSLDNNVFYGILELIMEYVPKRGRKPALLYEVEEEMNKGKRFSFGFSGGYGVGVVLPKGSEPIYLGNLTDSRTVEEFRAQLKPLFDYIVGEIGLFSNVVNNRIIITVADVVRQIALLQLGLPARPAYPVKSDDFEQRISLMADEIKRLQAQVGANQRELADAFGNLYEPGKSVVDLLKLYHLREITPVESQLAVEKGKVEKLTAENAGLHILLSESQAREFNPKKISPEDIARIPGDRLAQAGVYPVVAYGGKKPVEIRDIIHGLEEEIKRLKASDGAELQAEVDALKLKLAAYQREYGGKALPQIKSERDCFEQQLTQLQEENTRLSGSVDLLQRQLGVYRREYDHFTKKGKEELVRAKVGDKLWNAGVVDKLSAEQILDRYLASQLEGKVDNEQSRATLLSEAFGEYSTQYTTIKEMLDAVVRDRTRTLEEKLSEAAHDVEQLRKDLDARAQTITDLQTQLDELTSRDVKPEGYLDLAEAYDHVTQTLQPSDRTTQFTDDPVKFYELLLAAISEGTIEAKGNRFVHKEQLDGLIASIQK